MSIEIEVVTTFQRAETVWILAYIYDRRTGVAPTIDPTSIVVTISDPDGFAVVTAKAMTKHDDGEFEYFYTLPENAERGKWWRGLIKVVDGEGDIAKTTIGTFGFRIR